MVLHDPIKSDTNEDRDIKRTDDVGAKLVPPELVNQGHKVESPSRRKGDIGENTTCEDDINRYERNPCSGQIWYDALLDTKHYRERVRVNTMKRSKVTGHVSCGFKSSPYDHGRPPDPIFKNWHFFNRTALEIINNKRQKEVVNCQLKAAIELFMQLRPNILKVVENVEDDGSFTSHRDYKDLVTISKLRKEQNKDNAYSHIEEKENRYPPRRKNQSTTNIKCVRIDRKKYLAMKYLVERNTGHCIPVTTTADDRCKTFLFRWPGRPNLWYPFQLAAAGFFYPYPCKGVEIQCHQCNIVTSVDSWLTKETPSQAHYRLNSNCPFARTQIQEKFDQCGSTYRGNQFLIDFLNSQKNEPKDIDTDHKAHENPQPPMKQDEILNQGGNISREKQFQLDHQNGKYNLPTPETIDKKKQNPTNNDDDCNSCGDPKCMLIKDSNRKQASVDNHFVNDNIPVQSQDSDYIHSDAMNSQLTCDAFNSLSTQEPDFKYPQYQSISSRLRSFDKWKYLAKQLPNNLAEAGYFYTGENDIVRCFCCDLGLAEWDPKDSPWVEHARHNPKCWFLENKKGKKFVDDIQKNWRKIYNPKHAAFDDKESRLATFEAWRTDIEQTAEILADAGFFYTGEEDIVRCHYCDGGLRHWEPGDIPWEEHARWFPFCKFVIKMKGREYIEEVKRKTEERQRSNTLQHEDQGHEGYSLTYNDDAVKKLHELGMKENDIVYAVSEYQRRRGNSNFTAEDLIELILAKEETEKNNTRNTFKATQSFSNIEKPEEKDPQKIREINRKLKEKMKCVRCRSNEISMLFVNCGHRITCENCADKMDFCPVCDTRIKKRIKTFLS